MIRRPSFRAARGRRHDRLRDRSTGARAIVARVQRQGGAAAELRAVHRMAGPRVCRARSAPIEICVFAPNPFGEALTRALEGETVSNRTLSAREVRTPPTARAVICCSCRQAQNRARLRCCVTAGPYTVTVGESPRFEEMGGAVSLVVEGGRVDST